jgi:hypothetical protein
MRLQALWILLLPALLGQAPAVDGDPKADPAARARRDFLHALYLADAASYTIYRDAGRKEKAELRREPAYVWTNPTRNRGQDGAVFVWTCRGRAEVVGTIFSSPSRGPREVLHELHSLSTTVLDVDRPGSQGWKPLQPGIDPRPIPGAPIPARTAPLRLAQMRALIREFSASAVDVGGRRWELRVLAQPLYRYESTDPDVLDGAVFTLVSTAGTDPELMVVLEARKGPGEPAASWRFGAARFSDMALTVRHRDQVVYSAPVIPYDAPIKDPTHRYHLINDRTIPPVEETLAPKPGPVAPVDTAEAVRKP